MTVKDNVPETSGTLTSIDWAPDASGHFEEGVEKAHGRIEQHRIAVMAPLPGFVNYTHVAQIFRVTRERTDAWQGGIGETSIEHASAITPVPAERASPEQFPAWNRGHWSGGQPPCQGQDVRRGHLPRA